MTVRPLPALARARDAAAREDWADAYALLRALDTAGGPDGTGTPARGRGHGAPGTARSLAAGPLTPDDLVALADAAWWTGHTEESLDARLRAYAGYAAAGDTRRAGHTAWMLFYDHRDQGHLATATGWLHRAQQHLDGQPECLEQCYLAWIEAEDAQERGAPQAALAAARRMTRIARNCGSRDLLAMSHQVHGSLLLAQGRTADGLALLDDAMCAVTAGELSSLFTGWIYCLALTHCMAAADLRRAAEWTQAAMRWCASRPTANPFRGLCRVHQVEVLELRGDWPRAEAEAARACAELTPAMEPVAGEAHYVAGEIHRRRGDLAAAEAAYTRAHELGRSPQPGLALLWLAQGRAEPAVAALRLALAGQETGSRSLEGRDEGGPAPGPGAGAPGAAPAASPGPGEETGEGAGDDAAEGAAAEAAAAEAFGGDRLGRSRLLAAQVEVELALGNVPAARTAAAALDTLAATGPPDGGAGLLHATAATARGAVALAALTEAAESAGATGSAGSTGSAAPAGGMGGTTHAGAGAGAHARAGPEAGPALRHLRRALTCWLELRMPYEAAQVRMMLAAADRVAGDTEGARLELQAARTVFARMGAEPDARRAAALLSRGDRGLPGGLSPREAQVLRLVAAGRTNREIAHELTLSEHTVARHLNNIFAKLDVGSRAAATAYAFTHGLTGPDLA